MEIHAGHSLDINPVIVKCPWLYCFLVRKLTNVFPRNIGSVH